MSQPDPEAKAYLNKKVNPILEQLVVDLVMQRPEHVAQYMINWLKDKGTQLENNLNDGNANYQVESEDDDSSDDGEDLMDIKQLQVLKAGKQMRTSVSSEVYGKFNKKEEFVPKVIPKSESQRQRIRERLSQAFMFSALDQNEQKIVVDSMTEKQIKAQQAIITQGEDGDNLYVVDSGELDCFKKFKPNGENTYLKTYREGEAFGELALLYNAPRAATIIAKTNCTLFSLDRETFNHIVKDAASRKREKFESFLSKVDILENMEPYERLQIADAIRVKKYNPGDYIVKEGDVGETFFILEKGQAKAVKSFESGKEPQTVYNYKPGEYFGEIALLKNSLRAASVIAVTECECVYLDRQSFARLLGPLDEILKRNFAKYEKYVG
ncbi:Cyclic nucleotide-binding protein [Pseudocohnilembus persalinus]|uniref:cAMP-dependent protein kinase regulatory subunit n=1 Tax=Pseudocohnilembus persalinus TaxID=266149 RepID=A0A0V0QEN6_PSEPJ|nr:Cyclic nucleotide-binding protein [Pseudocohnilembus persalinus]|eukprot:KRX00652.1 Cyclic nucleotide-binding protein [Pseudocohnilembus persalinus]